MHIHEQPPTPDSRTFLSATNTHTQYHTRTTFTPPPSTLFWQPQYQNPTHTHTHVHPGTFTHAPHPPSSQAHLLSSFNVKLPLPGLCVTRAEPTAHGEVALRVGFIVVEVRHSAIAPR